MGDLRGRARAAASVLVCSCARVLVCSCACDGAVANVWVAGQRTWTWRLAVLTVVATVASDIAAMLACAVGIAVAADCSSRSRGTLFLSDKVKVEHARAVSLQCKSCSACHGDHTCTQITVCDRRQVDKIYCT